MTWFVSPFARFRHRPSSWLCVHIRRYLREPLCERPCLSTPGVLGSGSGYVVPIPHRLLRPHPSVSPARGDFTAQLLIRRVFAVRERRGDPRDLPYFRCCAFHTCHRPYAGGSEAPSRCVRAPVPGFLVLSLGRHPQHPSLPAISDGVMRFRRCIVRVMLRPAWLPGPPDWLRRRTGPVPGPSPAENRVSPAFHATCRHPTLGVRLDGRTGNLPSLGLSPNQSQQLVRLHDRQH